MAAAAMVAAMNKSKTEHNRGMTRYCEDQWAEAAISFGKAIELYPNTAETYEYKCRSLIHQARAEATEHSATDQGPNGIATGKLAYETAWRAVQKFGTSRWESLWVLAEATCLTRHYGVVSYIFSQITEHPRYPAASPGVRQAIEGHAKRHEGRGARSCRHSSSLRHPGMEVFHLPPRPCSPTIDVGDVVLSSQSLVNNAHNISPDTLLRVIELAREEDRDVAIRMSGVCKRWRDILVNQPGCWQKLSLGRGAHVMDKARAYLSRCRGVDVHMERGLKELRITDGFDSNAIEELGELLEPHAKFIQRLHVDIRPADARVLYYYLNHALESVRTMDIKYGLTPLLDFGLLPTDKCHLRELSLSNISHDDPRDRQEGLGEIATESTSWLDVPDRQLANLEILRMSTSYFASPISSIHDILLHTPKLQEIHLNSLTWWSPRRADYYQQATAGQAVIRLEHLKRWCWDSGRLPIPPPGYIPFQKIMVPNLTHLELIGVWDATDTCLAAGLSEALPSLRSLIVGKSPLPDHFIDVLRSAVSLEFLALPDCDLSPTFFDQFCQPTNGILPNLVALSLSGNVHVRTRYLREFLKGRAGPLPSAQPKPQDAPAESDAFLLIPSGPDEDMSPDPVIEPEAPSASYAESVPAPIAQLRWLNLDHCGTVDIRYFPKFQETLKFVSHWMGAPNDDRIRGRGKWDWEVVEVEPEALPEEHEGVERYTDKGKRVRWGADKHLGHS